MRAGRLLPAVLLVFVAACGKGVPTNFNVLPSPPPDGWAQLRVLHMASDLAPVDLYFRDVSEAMLTDLTEGFAQGFVEVAAQDYTVDLRPAGAALNTEPTVSFDISLASKERVTIVLIDGNGTVRLTDDLARIDAGALRVVNASSTPLSFDFGADGNTVTDLPSGESARATLTSTARAVMTVSNAGGAQAYVLPERPPLGDVLVVASDTTTIMLTYSFTVTVLEAP